METQKDRLKENRVQDVLAVSPSNRIAELQPLVEANDVADGNAPVRAAHPCREPAEPGYLTHRPGPFNDQDAPAAGLPIGPGEIERAHRYVIQSRLKLAGAWWKPKTAKSMLALRVCRANGDWDIYWRSRYQQAARHTVALPITPPTLSDGF